MLINDNKNEWFTQIIKLQSENLLRGLFIYYGLNKNISQILQIILYKFNINSDIFSINFLCINIYKKYIEKISEFKLNLYKIIYKICEIFLFNP